MDGSSEAEDPKDFALPHAYDDWESTRGRRRAGGVCQEFRDRAKATVREVSQVTKAHVCAFMLSHAQLSVTPWTVAYQAPPSIGFSRQEYWNG